MGKRADSKIFWIVLLLAAGLIVINGITTEVSLGDESHHYRFAQNIYWAGKRIPFDPLYESGNPPGFFYHNPPLWHLLLASLWKITGGISQAVAQIFHALFFILLVWLTSLLAKETVGEEERWFPAFIIVTVPMVVSFSTLFYMDVPMTALSTLSFYLILKRKYFKAGVASSLMFFAKMNGVFFFPGFLLLILWNERRRLSDLLRNLALFTLPIFIIHIPDLYWRKVHITGQQMIGWSSITTRLAIVRWREYLNSYLTNPADLVKYFGLGLLCLLLFHLLRFRRWERRDAILWIPVISYIISFILIFGVESDIRYLLPTLPFLVVLVTPSSRVLGRGWRFVLLGVCVLQFASTTYYVHQKRQILPEVKEGFEYIRRNVPEKALILYPEENLLIYGQRRIIWSAPVDSTGKRFSLKLLFWPPDDLKMSEILRAGKVDHILIKKSRIYDDREERHYGGYPKSFVERLPHLDGWVKVFENPGVALWKEGS